MRFGPVPAAEAAGAIAAHSVRAGEVVVKKGHRITEADARALAAAGVATVVVAKLEPEDIGEDEAAAAIAAAVAGAELRVDKPFTGRANLFAEAAGIIILDAAAIDRLNRVDEAITLATLPAFRAVVPGEMVATVKVIPYALPRSVLEAGLDVARSAAPLVAVRPFRAKRLGVISTLLPGLKPTVVRKTLDVLAGRLAPTGSTVAAEEKVAHEREDLAAALAAMAEQRPDIIVVFGASAITDRRDVIPAAIEQAGGRIEHLGMPVDPGNLLLIGELAGRPVIGAPGCARSPKENGFDWVLQRLIADVPVKRADIVGMGVGGLLMEIGTRPQPREGSR
jgi:molybdenum cofactor cytidylyltransferase